jgi:hypothetical protein
MVATLLHEQLYLKFGDTPGLAHVACRDRRVSLRYMKQGALEHPTSDRELFCDTLLPRRLVVSTVKAWR